MKTTPHRGWRCRTGGLAVIVALLSVVPLASAATYYVATTGNDSFTGLSPTFTSGSDGPFATLQRAVNAAAAGDTIAVRGGTYVGGVHIGDSFAAAPLTVTRYQSESVTLQTLANAGFVIQNSENVRVIGLRLTAQNVNTAPMFLNHVQNITVSNCTFASVSGNVAGALYIDDARNLTITDNRFESNTVWSLNLNRTQFSRVENNAFENNRALVTMYWAGGADSHDNTIARNRFVANYQPGGGDNLVLWLNRIGDGCRVEGNFIGQVTPPAAAMTGLNSAGIRVTATQRIEISANTISNYWFRGTVDMTYGDPSYYMTPAEGGQTGHGLMIHSDNQADPPLDGIRILNNTVIGSGNTGINLAGLKNGQVADNRVLNNGHFGVLLHGGFPGPLSTATVVEGNECMGNGWLNGGLAGISLVKVGRGCVVRRNLCSRNRNGILGKKGADWWADGEGIIIDDQSEGTYVLNNLLYDNEGAGILLLARDNVVMYNTVVGNGYCPQLNADFAGIWVQDGPVRDARNQYIANNILFNNRGRQIDLWSISGQRIHHNLMLVGPFTEPFIRQNNLVAFVNDSTIASKFMTLAQWQSYWNTHGGASGAGDLGSDPKLVGGSAPHVPDQFELTKTSPCINAGVVNPQPLAPVDYFGRPRVQQGVPDMGAAEYTGPDLTVTLLQGPASVMPYGSLSITSSVANVGQEAVASSFKLGFYLSADASITTSDLLIGSRTINQLSAGTTSTAVSTFSIGGVTPGTYYLGAIADYQLVVVEGNEANNALAGNTINVFLPPTTLARSPATLTPVTAPGLDALSGLIEVWNAGTGTLSYTVSESINWLAVVPASGTSSGEHDTLQVTYTTAGMSTGLYSGTITITATGVLGSPQTVGVTLRIRALAPPQPDFDGDGAVDLGVYHAATGNWYVRQSSSGTIFSGGPVNWQPGGTPVPGDYDGDGIADFAVYTQAEGKWNILQSLTGTLLGGAPISWGWNEAQPVPADYDGDGKTDLAVFYAVGGLWYILQSSDNQMMSGAPLGWGWDATIPVPSDYDGDGKADLAVYYPTDGLWYVRQSSDNQMMGGAPMSWGWSSTLPVPGDYDGDHKTDLAVYSPDDGKWYIRASSTGAALSGSPFSWGAAVAMPVQNDYDGDGKTDIGVYVSKSGKWYIRQSHDGSLLGGGSGAAGGVAWGHPQVTPYLPAYQVLRAMGLVP